MVEEKQLRASLSFFNVHLFIPSCILPPMDYPKSIPCECGYPMESDGEFGKESQIEGRCVIDRIILYGCAQCGKRTEYSMETVKEVEA